MCELRVERYQRPPFAEPVYYWVIGEPVKRSATLSGEPIRMRVNRARVA